MRRVTARTGNSFKGGNRPLCSEEVTCGGLSSCLSCVSLIASNNCTHLHSTLNNQFRPPCERMHEIHDKYVNNPYGKAHNEESECVNSCAKERSALKSTLKFSHEGFPQILVCAQTAARLEGTFLSNRKHRV